jgi:hypothetical protein
MVLGPQVFDTASIVLLCSLKNTRNFTLSTGKYKELCTFMVLKGSDKLLCVGKRGLLLREATQKQSIKTMCWKRDQQARKYWQ